MKFKQLGLGNCCEITPDRNQDERGWFSRVFCHDQFIENGFDPRIVQINSSFSKFKGTLRGIHFQREPNQETKIVRVLKGKLFDVMVDLREESETFGKWTSVELSSEIGNMAYIPRGFGHGILTLEDDVEIMYLVSKPYSPRDESGVRWDDPSINIKWPLKPEIISEKDCQWEFLAK